jgi:hypothetical protein
MKTPVTRVELNRMIDRFFEQEKAERKAAKAARKNKGGQAAAIATLILQDICCFFGDHAWVGECGHPWKIGSGELKCRNCNKILLTCYRGAFSPKDIIVLPEWKSKAVRPEHSIATPHGKWRR